MRNRDRSQQKKWDRKILLIAVIGLLLSGLRFLTYNAFDSDEIDPTRAVIGEIEVMDNDARHKNSWNYDWQKAKQHQAIQVGDSIYTGANSKSVIRLKDGSRVQLSESTLITMVDSGGAQVPQIDKGNVVLDLKGKMKISVNGEVFEIEGNGAKLEISKGNGESPVFNVLQSNGSVKIEHGKKSFRLAQNQKSSFPLERTPAQLDAPAVKWKKILPEPLAAGRSLVQIDRFEEFYAIQDGRLMLKPERSVSVRDPIEVKWTSPKDSTVYFESSRDVDFKWVKQQETSKTGQTFLKNATLGATYWRLSLDHGRWTAPAMVNVTAVPWKPSDGAAHVDRRELWILKDSVKLRVGLSKDPAVRSSIVEVSRDPDFRASALVRTEEKSWIGEFSETGLFYLRTRSLNANDEISAYSPVVEFMVNKPEWPTAPHLSQKIFEGTAGEPLFMSWNSVGPADLLIKDEGGNRYSSEKVNASSITKTFSQAGIYRATLRGSDRWGRVSRDHQSFTIAIRPKARLAENQPPPLLRRPTQETGSVAAKLDSIERDFMNQRYKNSLFQIEGAAVAQYSSEEVMNGNEVQSALAVTVRSLTWYGDHGAEGALKKALITPNTGGGTVDPLQIEAHYRHRWMTAFNPFSKLKESEISAILGYEMYKNSGTALMAPHYELMKVGFGLEFPLANRMDTGGEVLWGQGFDSSTKYEISGHFHYYLRRDLSMGAGYRMHLFTAGSDASSPLGVPYREAYGEAYSTLRWHY